jgi:hypothetical protein
VSDDLKARLAAAREAKAAAEARRAEPEDLEAEVVLAEREAREAEALADAEREHGKANVAAVTTRMGLVIVKRPHTVSFKKFQDDSKFDTTSLERFVRPCRVYPDVIAFDRILDEQPGVLAQLADRCAYLAGARKAEDAGK